MELRMFVVICAHDVHIFTYYKYGITYIWDSMCVHVIFTVFDLLWLWLVVYSGRCDPLSCVLRRVAVELYLYVYICCVWSKQVWFIRLIAWVLSILQGKLCPFGYRNFLLYVYTLTYISNAGKVRAVQGRHQCSSRVWSGWSPVLKGKRGLEQ